MKDLQDIDRRILRRIAAGGRVSSDGIEETGAQVWSLTPGTFLSIDEDLLPIVVGTTQWLAQFPGLEALPTGRLESVAQSDNGPVDPANDPEKSFANRSLFPTFVDLIGAGAGSTGGGSSAAGASSDLAPAATSQAPQVSALSFANPAHGAPSTNTHAASSRSSLLSFASPSIAAPGVGAVVPVLGNFPIGIHGYRVTDVHPFQANWTSSQALRASWGRLGGTVGDANGNSHAAIWNVSMTGFIDMHPTSGPVAALFPFNTKINDVLGRQSVGIGSNTRTVHALLWTNANPNSVVDLNPAGYGSSYGQATTGSQQIGYGYLSTNAEQAHALLWNGSAANFFDLNPTNYLYSYAFAGDSSHQAGYGEDKQFNLNALVWSGSAATAVSIHPTSGAFLDSRAITLSGTQAGGYGTSAATGYSHAILWTALNGDSAIDVNPAEFFDSQITAMNPFAFAAVGYGRTRADITGNTHALLWKADGSGYVDLSAFLPSRYTSSEADGIDANGNVVGYAYDTLTANIHAVEWLAVVPEPTSLISMAAFATLALTRIRRKSANHKRT